METYRVNVVCDNCKWWGKQEIKMGELIEVLGERECPICGCKKLLSKGVY